MQLLNAVREQVGQIDKEIPVNRPITMEEVVGQEVKQPRFNMALFTFFGGLGLALAAIGIFGVLSYSVARRTHEIGVRMALGADRSHVLGLMMAMGGKLVLTGLAVGLAGSLLLGRYLQKRGVFGAGDGSGYDCGCGDAAGSRRRLWHAWCRRGGRRGWSRCRRCGTIEGVRVSG